ncbi:hypothetical protein PVAP13_2NG533118 [Panicum virgatum]|uniref:Uncharacterized protein n=1 Tax=Panicum virgatum TaxID=38727 RepID=A0A8T0VHD6_PANVG|nr:hypothetical protein PVAP13_2NG533118 [Panicum virgatum]
MKENKLDAVVARHIKRQESTELVTGLAALAKQCLDMCGNNRPSMKEIANELGRLLKLSLHPWAQLDAETETESFLGGPSTSSIEIEVTTTSPYPSQDGENLPTNPMSSYYGR